METFERESRILLKNHGESCYSGVEVSLASQYQTDSSADNDDSFLSTVDVYWPILSTNLLGQKCCLCTQQNCDSRRHSTKSQWIYPTCENCGIELNDLIELIINRSVRSVESCEICLIKYQVNDPDCMNHVLKHFDRKNVSTVKQLCADCSSASSVDETKNDYLFVEKLEEVQLVDCKWCANTVCASAIKQHQRRCCKKPERIKNPDPRPQRFGCPHCPKKYSSDKNLSNHIISVHDPPSHQDGFKCRFCDKMFTQSERLTHEKENHRNEFGLYECLFCDRQCKSASEMENHRFKHTTPLSCAICGYECGMKRRLEEHMLIHSNVRDHQCNLCGEAFKTFHLLKRHKERRHSNVRPFQCKQCDKAYKDATDLRRHSRCHGGVEKSFKCEKCDKAFFEAKLLRNHMKAHNKRERNQLNVSLMVKNLAADEDEANVLIMTN